MVKKKTASRSLLKRRAPGTEATISTLANQLEESKAIEVVARHLERKFLQCAKELKVDLEKIKDESGHYGLAGDQIAKAKALLMELAKKDGVFAKIISGRRNEIRDEDLTLSYTRMAQQVENELSGIARDEFISFLDELMLVSYRNILKEVFENINSGVLRMDQLSYEQKKNKLSELKSDVSAWSDKAGTL